MPRPEGKPASITTVHRPSLEVLKQLYVAAMKKPGCWITLFWEDPKGRPFDAVNPYRESRGSQRENILKALSPEPGDENEILPAEITIYDITRNGVIVSSSPDAGRIASA